MKKYFLIAVALHFTACTTLNPQEKSPATKLTPIRATSSADNLFWIANPCANISGKPYKSYHSFALDEYSNTLWSRKKENSAPIEVKDKPGHGRVAWESVQDFFVAKKIAVECGQGPQAEPQQPTEPGQNPGQCRNIRDENLDSNRQERNDGDAALEEGNFVAPIQDNTQKYYAAIATQDIPNAQFKSQLHRFLSKPRLQSAQQDDQLVEQCPASENADQVCITQKKYDYRGARKVMFGDVDLRQVEDKYEVFDYYCQAWKGEKDFAEAAAAGCFKPYPPRPNGIVNGDLINTEHTWPQSKFTAPKGSKENLVQKTDLHHIFPTDKTVNADRGNLEMADIDPTTAKRSRCGTGAVGKPMMVEGTTAAGERYFEPPVEHKGNVARALMYFSARYNAGMSSLQEYYIRKWNKQDPPDAQEIARHEKIYKLTGVRNPFIDEPSWADRVARFCREKLSENQAALPGGFDCE
jgi:deoxyribonuclease I